MTNENSLKGPNALRYIFGTMKKIILFASFFGLLVSCSNPPSSPPERTNGYTHDLKTKEDSLMQDIMDGHDAAMAKMGRLAAYGRQAKQKADSLAKLNAAADQPLLKSLRNLADELQASENKMNAWMEKFAIDSAKNDRARRIRYLQSEKAKMTMVRNEVLAGIARADSLLKP